MSEAPQVNTDNRTEDQLLDAILRQSEFTRDAMESLPEEQPDVPAPSDAPDDDDLRAPEVEDIEAPEAPEEELTGEDDTSTQEPDVYGLEDLDDFMIRVKIDGEEAAVSIEELVKGYQTDQSLSKKGRELGDARKALDEERSVKIAEIDNVLAAASDILVQSENKYAKEYHEIEKELDQAREEGDTIRVAELKDKQEVSQKKYWEAHNERKHMVDVANSQKAAIQNEEFNRQLQHFSENITSVIPDWSEEIGMANREFALSKGIPESFLQNMVDINVIKFVDDYRRAEMARSTGAQKREKAPVRAIPTKKGATTEEKRNLQIRENKERVFSGEATKEEQDDFLRSLAERSLGNL